MAGLTAYQAMPESSSADAAWEAARGWMVGAKGLRPKAQRSMRNGRVETYGRASGGGGELAASDRGWLAVAGCWRHRALGSAAALLAALEGEGLPIFDEVDGMYAAVWFDAKSGELCAVPDHLGRLHLFAAEDGTGLFLSTSSIALARCVGARPDPLAVAEFLSSGTLFEDRTPFAGVRRLEAGARYRFRDGRLTERCAAPAPPWIPARVGGTEEGAERICAVIEDELAALLASCPRLLPDLTGGLDSRILVGLLTRMGASPAVTCTGSASDPDVRSAKELARQLGLTFRRIDPGVLAGARTDFASVLRRSALAECGCDALEYAGIAAIHEAHAAEFDASVNGSGGEVIRNYWWGRSELSDPKADAVSLALRHFARPSLVPDLLAPDLRLDPRAHFGGVLERSLVGLEGAPAHTRLDHLYLRLRMQCWQGGMASATNQIWPTFSPLLQRETLAAVFGLAPEDRLQSRLIYRILARMHPAVRSVPLATGFPPRRLDWGSAWRFAPRLPALARSGWTRALGRLGVRRRPDPAASEMVRRLMATGAGEYLRSDRLALGELLSEEATTRFLSEAASTGAVAAPLLGRLIALEYALRNGSESEVISPAADRG